MCVRPSDHAEACAGVRDTQQRVARCAACANGRAQRIPLPLPAATRYVVRQIDTGSPPPPSIFHFDALRPPRALSAHHVGEVYSSPRCRRCHTLVAADGAAADVADISSAAFPLMPLPLLPSASIVTEVFDIFSRHTLI